MDEQQVSEATVELAKQTMTGDLRDILLGIVKEQTVWKAYPESQQREIISRITMGAEAAVERAVAIIAADGRNPIAATLESITVKDGIKATLVCPKSEQSLIALGLRTGAVVQVVAADPNVYMGQRRDQHPDADQRALFNDEN
jgi:hypothetical protein